MQTTNNPSTVGCDAPDTLRAAKHHSYGSISLSFPWQGVIDHGPMWDFKMKTAGVFSGGGCRATERCTRWWNRQAGKDTETRAFTRPRTLRDWRDSIEEPETVDAAALTAAACPPWKTASAESCCFEMIFNWGAFFGTVSIARKRHARTSVRVRPFFSSAVATRRCLFWWFSAVASLDKLNVFVPRIFVL